MNPVIPISNHLSKYAILCKGHLHRGEGRVHRLVYNVFSGKDVMTMANYMLKIFDYTLYMHNYTPCMRNYTLYTPHYTLYMPYHTPCMRNYTAYMAVYRRLMGKDKACLS